MTGALSFAVAANEVWAFDGYLLVTGALSGDIKLAFTVPSGATLRWSGIGDDIVDGNGSETNWAVIGTSGASAGYAIQTTETYIRVRGTVVNGATAGSVQLQWAQNTSNVTATQVLVNSTLQASKY